MLSIAGQKTFGGPHYSRAEEKEAGYTYNTWFESKASKISYMERLIVSVEGTERVTNETCLFLLVSVLWNIDCYNSRQTGAARHL